MHLLYEYISHQFTAPVLEIIPREMINPQIYVLHKILKISPLPIIINTPLQNTIYKINKEIARIVSDNVNVAF